MGSFGGAVDIRGIPRLKDRFPERETLVKQCLEHLSPCSQFHLTVKRPWRRAEDEAHARSPESGRSPYQTSVRCSQLCMLREGGRERAQVYWKPKGAAAERASPRAEQRLRDVLCEAFLPLLVVPSNHRLVLDQLRRGEGGGGEGRGGGADGGRGVGSMPDVLRQTAHDDARRRDVQLHGGPVGAGGWSTASSGSCNSVDSAPVAHVYISIYLYR